MKILKNTILSLLVITIPMISLSQEEYTDAVYNKLAKEYVLNPDGTMEYHYYKELKILTHFAFHRLFGETFIVYDPTYQELVINEAYTIMADGKKVVAPENAFNEVLPRFARDIPSYNHMREMVVTHTGLEVGAVIVLDYTVITKDPFIPYLMGNVAIGENVPVKEMAITVSVPPNTRLKYKMLNLRSAPEITDSREKKSHKWTFRGLKANSMESYQDPNLVPHLLFSTAMDLPYVYFRFVDQPAFRHQLGTDLSKRVEEAMKDKKDDLKMMLALQDIVIKEVSLANIPLEHTGFKVRTPEETWQETNATELEKAIMLSDMLVKANISALPVAMVPNNEYDRAIGNLLSFEKFYVQVNPKETGRFYLSVTNKNDQNLIYELEDYTALQLDGAIESLRTFSKEAKEPDNEISLEGDIDLSNQGMLTGSLKMELEGKLNPYLKVLGNEDAMKGYLSGGINSSAIKTFKVKELNQETSLVEFILEKEYQMNEIGGYFFFDLPALSIDMRQYRIEGMNDTRDEPLKLPVSIDEEYSFTISIPDGWELISPEADIEIKNDVGKFDVVIQKKKSKIVVSKDIEINQEITPQQYEGFLFLVRSWMDEKHNRLVLKAN
jgi:hypothetical protein